MAKRLEKKLIVHPVNDRQRRKALKHFGDLLETKSKESVWQEFFDTNPFVLTETLSLKLDTLYRQVPLISGKPDYVFYRNTGNRVTGDFGVIEIKRPDQPIIGSYSSKIIYPSQTLRVAQQEVTQHLKAIQLGQFLNTDDFFAAGNRKYAFIIMGVTSELTRKCHEEVIRQQFQGYLLPPEFKLYAYDELFQLLSSKTPPTIQVLFASSVEDSVREITQEFTLLGKHGLGTRATALFVQTASRFHSEIEVTKDNETVNGKSIMGILMLGVRGGEKITVTIRGHDAKAAMDALEELLSVDFYAGIW